MKKTTTVVTALLMLALVHSAQSIWCFSCSSYEDKECATLLANDTDSRFYVNCTEPKHTFCRKTVVTIIDADRYVRVTRSCGFITPKENNATDQCYKTDDEFKFERSCQCFQDGCNAAPPTLEYSMYGALTSVLLVAWCNLIR